MSSITSTSSSNESAPSLPRRPLHTVVLIVVVMALWLMFSGKIVEEHKGHLRPDFVHLFFGALSCALIVGMTRHLMVSRYSSAENTFIDRLNWVTAFTYPFWLIKEVFKANVDVTKLLFQPTIEVDPVLVKVPFPVKSSVATTVLANSITLTPGTFTLSASDGVLWIHALDVSIAQGLVDGDMQRKVANLFGETFPDDAVATIHHTFEGAGENV